MTKTDYEIAVGISLTVESFSEEHAKEHARVLLAVLPKNVEVEILSVDRIEPVDLAISRLNTAIRNVSHVGFLSDDDDTRQLCSDSETLLIKVREILIDQAVTHAKAGV